MAFWFDTFKYTMVTNFLVCSFRKEIDFKDSRAKKNKSNQSDLIKIHDRLSLTHFGNVRRPKWDKIGSFTILRLMYHIAGALYL